MNGFQLIGIKKGKIISKLIHRNLINETKKKKKRETRNRQQQLTRCTNILSPHPITEDTQNAMKAFVSFYGFCEKGLQQFFVRPPK